MATRIWEWRDDERAEKAIRDMREWRYWEEVCRAEDDPEMWMYAGQRIAALSVIRTLFGVQKGDEIERLTREGERA